MEFQRSQTMTHELLAGTQNLGITPGCGRGRGCSWVLVSSDSIPWNTSWLRVLAWSSQRLSLVEDFYYSSSSTMNSGSVLLQ